MFRGGGTRTVGARSGAAWQTRRGQFVNGKWQCDCKPSLDALHLQTKKVGPNHGRWFYTCQKPMEDPDKCKFFLWETDAKVREEEALLNNTRTEPGRAIRTPSRRQTAITPPPAYTPVAASGSRSARKRTSEVIEQDETEDDDYGLDEEDPGFDDDLLNVAAVETPRKAAKTQAFTTPRRKLPWDAANGMPTPQTEGRRAGVLLGRPGDSLFTPSKNALQTPSKNKQSQDSPQMSSQTLSNASSSFNTPTPSRFKDITADSLVDDVFKLLDEENVDLSPTTATALKTILGKHSRRAEGNNKSKEVLRLRIKAEEAKNVELTHRNNTLQAELEAAKATVDHLNWEKEQESDAEL